jgi:hypothetical protein
MTDPRKTLTVVVTETDYELLAEPTNYNRNLAKLLTELGGINESVAPGIYHFYLTGREFEYVCHLDPIEE